MDYFSTIPRTSVKKLISLGLDVELSKDRRTMRFKISDNDLTKYKCDLIEGDNPDFLPKTSSILELNFSQPIKRKDSILDYFSTNQSDDLIFGYFQDDLMPAFGFQVYGVVFYLI
jgi:DNA polymerase III sliding clamp (beta) subunit (PCNA family)